MSSEEFLCVRCARHKKTCCQWTDIYVTTRDVERIREHSGREDFTEYRAPEKPEYGDQDDDPVWRDFVFRADGSRRVLQRHSDGDCTFLGERGCVLPLEIRPLVCRMYPYDYTAEGIADGFSEGCPLELLRPGQGLIEALAMNLEDANRWHQQLYAEVRSEGEC